MGSIENRKKNLLLIFGWDHNIPINVDELCEAGFYYTAENDLIRCFPCCGGLHNLEANDNALLLHKAFYPHCYCLNSKNRQVIIGNCKKDETKGNIACIITSIRIEN
jgi:hypothetical protein